MAFKVTLIEDNNPRMYKLERKLWLDSEGVVVEDGDPRAASLLGTPGKAIPEEYAQALGLVDAPEAEEDEEVPYDAWTVEELRAELVERDLPSTGLKAELVARLETDDLAGEE